MGVRWERVRVALSLQFIRTGRIPPAGDAVIAAVDRRPLTRLHGAKSCRTIFFSLRVAVLQTQWNWEYPTVRTTNVCFPKIVFTNAVLRNTASVRRCRCAVNRFLGPTESILSSSHLSFRYNPHATRRDHCMASSVARPHSSVFFLWRRLKEQAHDIPGRSRSETSRHCYTCRCRRVSRTSSLP